MPYLKDTAFYNEAITELQYDFGNYYLFDSFVVGEVHADVVFTWEHHAKHMVTEVSRLYEQNGDNLVYLTNRMNDYSVVPTDWLHFFKYSYGLKGYGIINYSERGLMANALEKLFLGKRLKSFKNIENAIHWAKMITGGVKTFNNMMPLPESRSDLSL